MNVFNFLLFFPNPITIFLSVFSLRCWPQLLGLLSSSFNANSFVVWLFPTRRRNAWKRRSSPPQWAGRAEQGAVAVAGAGAKKPEATKRSSRERRGSNKRRRRWVAKRFAHSFIAFYLDSSLADSSLKTVCMSKCVFAIYYMWFFLNNFNRSFTHCPTIALLAPFSLALPWGFCETRKK